MEFNIIFFYLLKYPFAFESLREGKGLPVERTGLPL
jgi:hypothetical protein